MFKKFFQFGLKRENEIFIIKSVLLHVEKCEI